MSITYKDSGVDIDTADRFVDDIKSLIQRTHRPEVLGSIGGFSGLFSLPLQTYKDPVLVSSTDGVGTKLKVAMLCNQHKTIGIDLVAMCVNDVVVCGAEPLFFLDYFATGHLDPEHGKDILTGVVEGCVQAGCALLGGETAEMPGLYHAGDYDLAGFAVGIVERDKILGYDKVQPGDLLLGLASNGLHSNGYSLVRKALLSERSNPDEVLPGLSTTLGQELLKPTKIYVKPILDMIRQAEVHGVAHITGGGLHGNLPRVIPEHLAVLIDWKSWPTPAIFQIIQAAAELDDSEMLKTFNLGIGMVAVIPPDSLHAAQQTASNHGIDSWVIGRVIARRSNESQFIVGPPGPNAS